MPARRPSAPAAAVALATLVALASVFHSGGHVWRSLEHRYRASAKLTGAERRQVPLDRIGLPGDVFDFYRDHTGRGDRIFLDLPPGASGADLNRAAFTAAAGFSLLPATVTSSLADATVVLSDGVDPHRLDIPFVTQVRLGRKPVYVSRINSP